MRLIDADALMKLLNDDLDYNRDIPQRADGVLDAIMDLMNVPTVEAEPVKHGKWEIVYYDNIPTLAYCSRCDQTLRFTRETEKMPNYCPNCGARMDLDEVKE